MSTAKLARRMWWVGTLGWGLLASAGVYWRLADIVLIEGGRPVVILLTLLLGGAFLAGLASAWFGWFSVLTDRVLAAGGGAGGRSAGLVALLGLFLSPAVLVLVLRSVGDRWSPMLFGVSWVTALVLLGACLYWLRRWIADYTLRTA